MKTIKGKFEVQPTPATPDENIKKMNGMAMFFEKTFSGSINAKSKVSMFGIMNKDLGSGGYVALELMT